MQEILIEEILKALPHRYPFLLVDKVIDFTVAKQLIAIKNVSVNEPFFNGHFPNHPVMPGVLILEAMAQASGLLTYVGQKEAGIDEDTIFYLVKIDNAKFTQKVVPGDQLKIVVEHKRSIKRMNLTHCEAFVDDKLVAKADILCAAGSR